MAATTAQTTDVTAVLADMLGGVAGLRVYPYVSDATRPPAVVIGQPRIDFADSSSGFCAATWEFPLTVITTRSNDWAAQSEMSQLLLDIVAALSLTSPVGVFSIEPLNADPQPVTLGGMELPGYLLTVRVRA